MSALGRGPEFDLIRALEARWGARAAGLGDDAALLTIPRGERAVVSTDAAVEGSHFRVDWLSLPEIGYRATMAALSDLAAMAAHPLGILVAFTAPPSRTGDLLLIADGIGEAVQRAGTVIVGGNLAAGAQLTITTTVVGHAFHPLPRAGARPGDRVFVTGLLGGPRAAVRAFADGRVPATDARARFARPVARIPESRWLAGQGVGAAIDISDGLAADAGHVAAASGVTLAIDADRIPLCAGALVEDAIGGGEEYELLVTAPSLDTTGFVQRFGIPLTEIGQVTARGPNDTAVVLTRAGRQIDTPMGFDHFSR